MYEVVSVNLLDYLLDITTLSELETQAFLYTCINICYPCVCDKYNLIWFDVSAICIYS